MEKLKKFLGNRPLERVFFKRDQIWANEALNNGLVARNAQKPITPPLPVSITVPGEDSGPSDEELSKAVQDYLSAQDPSTVTLRCVVLPLGRWRRDSLPSNRTAREAIGLLFPRVDLSSKRSFLNESIGNHVWAPPPPPPPPAVPPPVISSARKKSPRPRILLSHESYDDASDIESIASSQRFPTPPRLPSPVAAPLTMEWE